MALVQLPQKIMYPDSALCANGAPAFTNANINTIGYGVGFIFTVDVNDTITKIGFRTGSINAGTLQVRVETVSATTGLNTGTLWGTNTNGTVAVVAADDNKWFEVTLTSPATVSIGDTVAVIVQADTSSIGSMSSGSGQFNSSGISFPTSILNNTGAWAIVQRWASISVCYGTSGYIPINGGMCFPASAYTSRVFNNTSTPDVYGNTITMPFSCTVSGCWVTADIDGDAVFKLYDTDGVSVLTSVSIDADIGATSNPTRTFLTFDSSVNLLAGNTYFLGIEPSTATSITTYECTFNSSDIKKMIIDSSMETCSAKDPSGTGDWTVDSASWSIMGLIISHIDDGSGIMPNAGLHPIEQGIST